MSHQGFRFDDYHIWGEFWHSLNSEWEHMEYVYKCKNEIYNKEYNIPYEILMTLKYISSLKYDSVPNYEYITGIFKNWITII